ncbi:MAG: mechanosensitive ion channel [Polyangiaceae bacterium]|nr:mechanosensitive ion channel [Polyangiaceae bacterium]
MNFPAEASPLALVFWFSGGVVLVVLLAGLGRLARFLPIGRVRRELVVRAAPLAGGAVTLGYVLLATGFALQDHPIAAAFGFGLVLIAGVGASWFAIRDFVAGAFLRAERVCQPGDVVQIGDIQGRVVRMGLRVMAVETMKGDEAVIPYGLVARESLLRTAVSEGVALHVFQLAVPNGMPGAQAKTVIRHAALRSHFASAVREPVLRARAEGGFEVTVFALDADRAADVEASVRDAIARA